MQLLSSQLRQVQQLRSTMPAIAALHMQQLDACAVMLLMLQGAPWPHAKGGIRNVRGTPAVCLGWHPDKQLLAIAWQDGAMSIWDAAKCHLEEDSKSHRHPIGQLLWHPDGKHFMTADVQGKVGRMMSTPHHLHTAHMTGGTNMLAC